jgi:ABC-type lipoprotein export system ATPase subunit
MTPLIDVCDVVKIYQIGDVEVHALRGVSLAIDAGRWKPCDRLCTLY